MSFNQFDDRNMGRIRNEKVSEADEEVVLAERIVTSRSRRTGT
jgi:hypothetical protein